MDLYKYKGTGNNGFFSWLMQRISAIVLIFAITYHLIGMITGKINGISAFLLGVILIFGIWHGVNGIKMITDDYVASSKIRAFLTLLYWVIGVGLIFLGLKIISMMAFN